jgi:DNA polymerase-3 subunit epsilon
MKILFIDTETTGLFEHINHIWQIAAIYDEDGKFKAKFEMKAAPPPDAKFNKDSLETSNITMEELWEIKNDQRDLKEMFEAWLSELINKFNSDDKMFFAAYNSATFDYPFCRQLWKNHNDNFFGSFFWFPDLDIMRIAAWALNKQRHLLPNFKLATVAKAVGIPIDTSKQHSAMYDCRIARQIYYAIEGD